MMEKISLGDHGPIVSKMGFGCMGMSGNYESDRNDDESIKTIQAAYEMGVNFFDTADVYGGGHSETLLGKALREVLDKNRDKVVIATKCGFVFNPDRKFEINLSPNYIKNSCEASLQRLGISYIDLYYMHRLPSGGVSALKESLDAYIDLLKSGKIKNIGLSEADAESIRFTHEYLKKAGFPNAFVAVQSEMSLFVQNSLMNDVFKTCEALGIAFVPFSPLCRGMLSDKVYDGVKFDENDFRRVLPMFQGENFKVNLNIRAQLADVAKSKNISLSQLALAWLYAQGKYVFPIPGTRHIKNFKNNVQATEIKLSQEDLQKIHEIVFINGGVKGTRYPVETFKLQNIKTLPNEESQNAIKQG